MVSLKICGLTQPADVAFCCACGVDLVGFVVDYPKRVPWNLDVPRARELMTRLSGKKPQRHGYRRRAGGYPVSRTGPSP